MINTDSREDLLLLLSAYPEATLNDYCHEGCDVYPEHQFNEQGAEILTGRWVAEICSAREVGATRDEAIQALADKVHACIQAQPEPGGC